MKNTTRPVCTLLMVPLLLTPAPVSVMAQEEESSLPFWDPARYGVHGRYTPWTLSGDVGLRLSYNLEEHKSTALRQRQHQWYTQLRAGKGAEGYVIEPYIAQWRGDILMGLTLSQTISTNRNTQDDQNGGSSSTSEERKVNLSAQSLQGNADVRLFPQSGFPFQFYFNRANSGNSGGNSEASSRLSQRFGITQQYRDREAELSVRLQAERRLDDTGDKANSGLLPMVLPSIRDIEDSKTMDTATLRIDKRLDDHSLELMARLAQQDGRTRIGKGLTWERSVVLSHNVAPMEELSISNQVNVTRSRDFQRNMDEEARGIYRETDAFQLSQMRQFTSNAFWRTSESPLLLNATFRVYQEDLNNAILNNATQLSPSLVTALGGARPGSVPTGTTDPSGLPFTPATTGATTTTGSSGNRRALSVNARLGAGYRFDEHHNVNGALVAIQETRETVTEEETIESVVNSFGQSAAYQYDSGPIPLEPYNYSWFSGTTVANTISSDLGTQPELGERIGHGVERIFPLEALEAEIRLSVDESAGMRYKADPEMDLTHTVGLGYESSAEGERALIDLRLTDSHTLTDPKDETQLVNLQLMRNASSEGGADGWSGSLAFNWMRRMDQSGLLTISESASGSLNYTIPQFMDVSRLRYDMITTISGDSWAMGMLGPSEQEISWRNLLSYNIGKIHLRMGGELKYLHDKMGEKSYQALLTFDVVRNFYRRFEQ
ncbi:MAG: hypothetical protein G8237_06350 [Magnetococcales bacterium]|nr:hypothetical protein [Magnetococcales bacterium]